VIDNVVRGSLGDPFRIVWANGNERGSGRCGTTYLTTAPPACAKNHITVGALNSNDDSVTDFTSWGPTDDGRIKPDVSAPGCQSNGDGGVTSSTGDGGPTPRSAAPRCPAPPSGLSALLVQDFRTLQYPGEPDFRNSTLKASSPTPRSRTSRTPAPTTRPATARSAPSRPVDLIRSTNFLEAEVTQGGALQVLVHHRCPGDGTQGHDRVG
jgi:hypothetical protein